MNIQRTQPFHSLVIGFVAMLLCLSLLAGCAGGPVLPKMTAQELEDSVGGGPEVEGVEAALVRSAESAVEEGNHYRAVQLYKQLANRWPDNHYYVLMLAESLRRDGKFKAAIDVYDQYAKLEPNDLASFEGKGLAFLSMGEIAKAESMLNAVGKRDSTRWRVLNALGIVHSMQYDNDKALKFYRAALKQKPRNASILNNIGLTLAIQEQYHKAVQAFELASKYVDNQKEEARRRIDMNLALCHALSGDMDSAEQVARIHLSDEAELYNNLGHFAYLANNKKLAKTYLNMALTSSKSHYDRAWKNLERISKVD